MRATRAASEDELLAQSLPRAQALVNEGVTTLEVKSGTDSISRAS
jgi:imidazolonepropionase